MDYTASTSATPVVLSGHLVSMFTPTPNINKKLIWERVFNGSTEGMRNTSLT